jgi:hypothetical protein
METLDDIVTLLNERCQRATYGAVAGVLGVAAVGLMNGLSTDRCAKRLTFAELQPGLGEERTDQLGPLTQTTDRKV